MMAHNPEVVRAFDGARDYDRNAPVQRQVAEALAERIAALDLPEKPDLLEIGCGTGFLARALRSRQIGGQWLLTDIAPAMLDRCRTALGPDPAISYAVVDGEAPQLPAQSFHLIVSSFTFRWFADLGLGLARLASLLRPGGTLAFATMLDGSFAEWREAHLRATGLEPAMRCYPTSDALAAMAPPGCTLRIEEERIAHRHDDARAFLRSLKAIGAHRPLHARAPLAPAALRRAMAAFDVDGARISYRVGFGMLQRED
jgi:malonyl-CoA O-methyltransferase